MVLISPPEPRPHDGAIITGELSPGAATSELRTVRVLTPSSGVAPAEILRVAAKRPALSARAAVLDRIRAFFSARGFLEVETPARVLNPGLEPHLVAFPAGRDRDGLERRLITSPELHLKRLLCAGYERVFELARAFRDEEHGRLHLSEFTLLEWYRAYQNLEAIAADLAALLPELATAAGRDPRNAIPGADLTRPFTTITYAQAFRQYAHLEPWALTIDDRERAFIERVEPRLGCDGPVLLLEYPPDVAALARLVPPSDGAEWPLVAARMELYLGGVEIANAFDELTDANEQRARHLEDQLARTSAGQHVPPLDEGFLAALAWGMPPSAGVALGVDRLIMLLTGATDIGEVRAFPT